MSCMVMDYNSVAQLAGFITALCEDPFHSFNYFGFDVPETLSRAFTDCRANGHMIKERVFKKLVRFNLFAYNGRYTENVKDDITDMPDVATLYRPKRHVFIEGKNGIKDSFVNIKPWHYQLYKTVQCYTYQLAEDATINSDVYKAFTDLENTLARFIVANQIEYIDAKLG